MNGKESFVRIHVYGVAAICLLCGGTMLLKGLTYYHCIDCGSLYQIDSEGIADREITVKMITATDFE